jgi:hypothetical protein
MLGSSHIQSVLIGVEYRNFRRNLDVYFLFFSSDCPHSEWSSKLDKENNFLNKRHFNLFDLK